MISKPALEKYISSIPPIPNVVKACAHALEEGDLVKAADEAAKDGALMLYLRQLVNKPIFGFRSTIKEPRQLFGILGLSRARQLLCAYYTQLLLPKKWEVFHFVNISEGNLPSINSNANARLKPPCLKPL